jgi:hypothetical protein
MVSLLFYYTKSYSPEEHLAGWARSWRTADVLKADGAKHVPFGALPDCASTVAYVCQAHDAFKQHILVARSCGVVGNHLFCSLTVTPLLPLGE